jgi:hypothetical protein
LKWNLFSLEENSAHNTDFKISISHLSGTIAFLKIYLPFTYRFSTLKEMIEKELGVRDALILDERGIDITTLHTDDLV